MKKAKPKSKKKEIKEDAKIEAVPKINMPDIKEITKGVME